MMTWLRMPLRLLVLSCSCPLHPLLIPRMLFPSHQQPTPPNTSPNMASSSPPPNLLPMQLVPAPPNNIATTVRLASPPSARYTRFVAERRELFSDDADNLAKRDASTNRFVEGVSSPLKVHRHSSSAYHKVYTAAQERFRSYNTARQQRTHCTICSQPCCGISCTHCRMCAMGAAVVPNALLIRLEPDIRLMASLALTALGFIR